MSALESQIQELQRKYDTAVGNVMADRDSSIEYKAKLISSVYDETRTKAEKVISDERDKLEVELRSARREVFQPVLEGARDSASLWASYRECLDRAKKLTSPSEVREALNEAELVGDDLMAKALQWRAVQLGDSKSLDLYLGPRPEEARKYERLIEASEAWNAFEKGLVFHGLSRFRQPEEITPQLQA